MNSSKPMARITVTTLLMGLLIALAVAPFAGATGAVVNRTNETMTSDLADLKSGWMPGVTTITDGNGDPMAYLYKQQRYPVPSNQIAQSVKDALVAIEDRRFYEHNGIDFQGTARALVTNLTSGGISQGASTINQQYVKNYLLHIIAKTPEEQTEATEQSVVRKLREMRMATQLDKDLSKDEILTRYLNLVPFGNHTFGVEAAARVYFDTTAANLTVPQSAMLAGMVQSSEYLNPYTNADEVRERRNTVLQAMVSAGYLNQMDADNYAAEDLGVTEAPSTPPNGCIAAGDRGFFCDYVVTYLKSKGLTEDQIYNDGLTIHTTLDPAVQDAAHYSVTSMVNPMQTGVAEVLNVVEPGKDSRRILAMTSSRDYGLDLDQGQTYLPQPTSMVGDGAGSVFKVFTAAVALKNGMKLDTMLDVPTRYQASGMGTGGAAGCPPGMYCVENAGTYAPHMTLEEALAQSPNTTFVQLIERYGVSNVVDMAVKLGLRSYAEPGSYDEDHSIADYFKDNNLGSFTLGPTAVNPLELSNVGATLGSQGMWCEPDPVDKVTTSDGHEVALEKPACEQVLDPSVANTLAKGMTADAARGTARDAALAYGYSGISASKTGTTETHQSAAFLGFNNAFAAAPYIYNDGTTNTPLCTGPVRQCEWGSLYGGMEPARTYYMLANQSSQALSGTIVGGWHPGESLEPEKKEDEDKPDSDKENKDKPEDNDVSHIVEGIREMLGL